MKNFAHRGFSGMYPENTMLAFHRAAEIGADGIELDVQLTKDGQLVVIHDEQIDRTTNGRGNVRDYTLRELQQFDASYIYTGKIDANRIPTFEEYCDWVKDTDLITNIELKNGVYPYPGMEEKVLDVLLSYHLQHKVIISSFNHFSVLHMRELAPHLTYGLLTETWLIHPGQYTKDLGIACYHPYYGSLTDDTVAELKKHHIIINTFTVNDERSVRDMLQKGVDCVISNFPNMVNRVIKEAK